MSKNLSKFMNLLKKFSDYPFLIHKLPQKGNLPQVKKHWYKLCFSELPGASKLARIWFFVFSWFHRLPPKIIFPTPSEWRKACLIFCNNVGGTGEEIKIVLLHKEGEGSWENNS